MNIQDYYIKIILKIYNNIEKIVFRSWLKNGTIHIILKPMLAYYTNLCRNLHIGTAQNL